LSKQCAGGGFPGPAHLDAKLTPRLSGATTTWFF
jgi:hypothetical protein